MTMETLTELATAGATQSQPVTQLSLPSGAFDSKQLRRILSVQFVVQLAGSGLDVAEFRQYVRAVDRFIEGGMLSD